MMNSELFAAAAAPVTILVVLVAAIVLTGLIRRRALSRGLLDIPNARSSHTQPTPTSGGIAIVVASQLGFIAFALRGDIGMDVLAALAGGGIAIALVGFIDDRYHLSAGRRLAFHGAAALYALIVLGGVPPLQLGTQTVDLGAMGYLLGVAGIVWTLNLFNFMDGIDGIAASEAAFITCAGALLVLTSGAWNDSAAAGVVLSVACCGFLVWNWPPAKIFMGDVGSGYLGYAIAVLALATGRESPVALLVWVILGGVFFVDATVTLLRRVLRGKKAHEAHRTHGYQHLARRWGGHLRVTRAVLLLNLAWLLPCATIATRWPNCAAWLTVAALAPLVAIAITVGAGQEDTAPIK